MKDSGEKIEAVDIDQYPAIKEWLDNHWEKISKRGDRGKTPYNLRNCAYQIEFEKEKMVYNDITKKLSFSISKPGEYFNNTVYFIENNPNLYFQMLILNSSVTNWYYKQISAQLGEKAVRMFSIYVKRLPIPQISPEAQKPFISLVDQILKITSKPDYDPKNPPVKQNELEQQIDEMVMDLYELTDEEKEIVRKS